MLYIILGNLGSGKTLLMTYFATKIKEKPIYSNYKLKIKNYIELKAVDLINLPNSCEVFLDEGYTWLESRISASQLNRYMSYLLLQSRKRNVDFFITAQLFSSIDKRYRQKSDIIIVCEKIVSNNELIGFKYKILNKDTWKRKTFNMSIDKAKELFNLYDTNEIIEPFDNARLEYNLIKNDTKLLIKMSEKIAEQIKPKLKRITHNNVKLAIMKAGLDKNFEPMVYAILKSE